MSSSSASPARNVRPRLAPAPPPPIGFRGVARRKGFGVKKPKAKKKPAAKKKAKKLNPLQLKLYLSPFKHSSYPPAVPGMGMYLCVTDQRRLQLTMAAGAGDFLLLFSPSVSGAINCYGWTSNGSSVTQVLTDLATNYPYRTGGEKTTPVAWRPFRAGIKVQNLSASTARQGSIHILNSSSPIKIDWNGSATYDVSTLTFAGLASSILSNPRQRTYTAEQCSQGGASVIAYPTSMSAYNGWSHDGFLASTATHDNRTKRRPNSQSDW